MTLYELKVGKSKNRLTPIMVGKLTTIQRYLTSSAARGMSGQLRNGQWFVVSPTTGDEMGRKPASRNGYIDKHGFNHHT